MKTAVISDIHGNFQALEAVLADIKAQGAQAIWCCGDLALAGPEPVRVVDFVMQQDWEVIQGNTDQMIALCIPSQIDKSKFPAMANALEADALLLNAEQREFLRDLPKQKELEVEGVKVLLVHGSPRSNSEYIYPDQPSDKIEAMIAGVDVDLIFCGHSHMPSGYQLSKTVVNVGSVGRPMTGNQACYALVDFENGEFSVEHRFVDYDRETAAKLLIERGFDGAKEIAALLINPTQAHV
jgi:putative phosphoesterase